MAALMMVPVSPALAETCTKVTGQNADLFPDADPGTVVCTTIDKPGKSDLVGKAKPTALITDETQGNETNKKPAPQDLADEECTLGSVGLCKQAAG